METQQEKQIVLLRRYTTIIVWQRDWQCEYGYVLTERGAAETPSQLCVRTEHPGREQTFSHQSHSRFRVSQGRHRSSLQVIHGCQSLLETDLSPAALGAGAVAADAVTVAEVRKGPRRTPRLQVPRHPHRGAHLQPVVHPRLGQVAVRQALLGLTERKHWFRNIGIEIPTDYKILNFCVLSSLYGSRRFVGL